MPTLLHLDVSPRGERSLSRQRSAAAANAWKVKNPDGQIIERDLTKTPLTFVDLDWILGSFIRGFIGITNVTFIQAGGTARVAQGQVSSQEFLAPLVKQLEAAV